MADEDPAGLSQRSGRVNVLDDVRPLVIKSSGLLIICGIESVPNRTKNKNEKFKYNPSLHPVKMPCKIVNDLISL